MFCATASARVWNFATAFHPNSSYCEQMFYMRYKMDAFRMRCQSGAGQAACRRRRMADRVEPRDLVGSLHKGLDVLAILATHPAGMTLTEMAAAAGLTRAGRTALAADAGCGRLCRAGRPPLRADAAAARPRPPMARRHVAVDLRRAAHAGGGGAAEGILLGRGAVGRGCRLCRPRSRRTHHERRAACRHAAAGLLHLDGPRPAVRSRRCGTGEIPRPRGDQQAYGKDGHRPARACTA